MSLLMWIFLLIRKPKNPRKSMSYEGFWFEQAKRVSLTCDCIVNRPGTRLLDISVPGDSKFPDVSYLCTFSA